MTVNECIALARACAGKGKYRMGGGANHPESPVPWGEDGTVDCSGFCCWAVGLAKYQPKLVWLKRITGGWFSTNGIWWDAVMESTGHFSRINKPRPGCIVVYPSSNLAKTAPDDFKSAVSDCPKVGHVGLVTVTPPGLLDVNGRESIRVIHASSLNQKMAGYAIRETGIGMFEKRAAIWAWPSTLES